MNAGYKQFITYTNRQKGRHKYRVWKHHDNLLRYKRTINANRNTPTSQKKDLHYVTYTVRDILIQCPSLVHTPNVEITTINISVNDGISK